MSVLLRELAEVNYVADFGKPNPKLIKVHLYAHRIWNEPQNGGPDGPWRGFDVGKPVGNRMLLIDHLK